MSEELEDMAKKIGDQFFTLIKVKLEKARDELSEEGIEALESAARDRAGLTLRALKGEDVSGELAIVDATIANWTWVGANKARNALVEAAKEVADLVGILLGTALKGIL